MSTETATRGSASPANSPRHPGSAATTDPATTNKPTPPHPGVTNSDASVDSPDVAGQGQVGGEVVNAAEPTNNTGKGVENVRLFS